MEEQNQQQQEMPQKEYPDSKEHGNFSSGKRWIIWLLVISGVFMGLYYFYLKSWNVDELPVPQPAKMPEKMDDAKMDKEMGSRAKVIESTTEEGAGEPATVTHMMTVEYYSSADYSLRELLKFSVSVSDGTITALEVFPEHEEQLESENFTSFRDEAKPIVVGKSISDVEFDVISGSSDSTSALRAALDHVKGDDMKDGMMDEMKDGMDDGMKDGMNDAANGTTPY